MNFIIYDLEATCWLGKPPGGINEIIEIGAFKINIFGDILGEFSKFVKPVINPVLSSFCKKLTSIQQHQIDRANHFPIVVDQFQNWINLDEDNLLCSWGEHDIPMFCSNCDLHDIDTEWLKNSTDLKKQYHKIKGKHRLTGLKNTIRLEGLEFVGKPHRAIYDAENLKNLFVKFADEWEY